MQKNLGYVIPSLVIPDATTGIGYWYLGNVPLGVRATGTMWTIGEDHYWYVDNTKTDYLAEIPVEVYNAQWQEMITNFNQQWTTYFTDKTAEIDLWFNTAGASFTLWFNRMKNQLSTDAAGNLQAQIDQIGYNFSDYVEPYTISSQAYAVGTYIVHNNQTFEVVKAIAQGDTFNSDESDANHNIEARTIGETMELVADNIKYDHTSSALSAADVQAAIDEIVNTLLKASDNLKFQFTKSGGKYGYKDTNGNFIPFKVVQASKTVTAGTAAQTVTPDSGYDGIASVTVNPTPSQTKSASPSTSAQTISPDSGKLLSSVSISAISPQRAVGTAATLTGIDSTGPFVYFPYGWWPYVNTSSWGGPADSCYARMTAAQARALHSHTSTFNVFRTGTKDMGNLHSYRYINCQPLWRIYSGQFHISNSSSATVNIDTKENQAQQYVIAEFFVSGNYQWDFTPSFVVEGSNNNSTWTQLTKTQYTTNINGYVLFWNFIYDTYAYSNVQRTRYRYYRAKYDGGPSSGINGYLRIMAIVCHTLSDV